MHLSPRPAPLSVEAPGFWRDLARRLRRTMPRWLRPVVRAGLLCGDADTLDAIRDAAEFVLLTLAENMECPSCRFELRLCMVALTMNPEARRALAGATYTELWRKRRGRKRR